jgi:hypothetical protein
MRDRRPRVTTLQSVGFVAAVLALVTAACGSSATAAPPATAARVATPAVATAGPPDASMTGRGGTSGGGPSGGIETDSNTSLTVVNLYTTGSAGGTPIDIYANSSAKDGDTPTVAGLEYGKSSAVLHPGRPQGSAGSGGYGLVIAPAGQPASTARALLPSYTESAILVVGRGQGTGVISTQEFPTAPGQSPNNILAADPGKIALTAAVTFVGDPNAPQATQQWVMLGAAGKCLSATYDSASGIPSAITSSLQVLGINGFYADPATTSVGFYLSPETQAQNANCTGTPIATAGLPVAAAGSRFLVVLSGASTSTLTTVVVPVAP